MARHAITLALSLVVLFALCSFASAQSRDETGQPAPRFRARTTTGEQFNNESTKGKIVLFEFWTTWCKYCEEEAQLVDDIAKEFKSKDLIVLAVDVLEPDKTVKTYLAQHPRTVPIVLTKDTNLAAMYNAQVYPIYVVVDRDGNIAGEQRGAAACSATPAWNPISASTLAKTLPLDGVLVRLAREAANLFTNATGRRGRVRP